MAIDLTSEELKLFKAGDSNTIRKVASSFEEELRFYAKKFVKNEAAAFAIMKAVTEKLNSEHEKLETNEYIKNFLYLITRRLSFNWLRDHSNNTVDLPLDGDPPDSALSDEEPNPHDILAAKLEARLYHDFLTAAIDTLKGKHQQVARLYFLEKYDVETISQELNINPKAVKDHLDYAIKRIQKFSKKEQSQKFLNPLSGRRFL